MRAVQAKGSRASGVGADLRALRKSRGLTLTDLALRVGRSIGWLSQVERGMTEPAVDDLRKLAETLEQPISFFFGRPATPPEECGIVVRAGGRRVLGTADAGLVEELLSPDLGGPFQILRCVFAPGAERAEHLCRPTDEAGYIISGTLELDIGERTFRLDPGDSFRVAAQRTRWRNPGGVPCVVIWVIAPPVY